MTILRTLIVIAYTLMLIGVVVGIITAPLGFILVAFNVIFGVYLYPKAVRDWNLE